MIQLDQICEAMNEDVQSVVDWCNQIYDKNFSEYFKDQRDLFKRLQSKVRPITDEELEWILTSLPLQLFSVSEKLSNLKITQEVIRMKNKQSIAELVETSAESTQTKKKEQAELVMLENKLVDTVYSSILSRVDSEMSFSRELIMSAKKIWDRRRAVDNTVPIGMVDAQIAPTKDPRSMTFYEQQQTGKGQKIYG